MKQLEKMSLANVRNKLTRKEMSNIMAGSGGTHWCACYSYYCMRYLGKSARCGMGDGACCDPHASGGGGSW